MSGPWQLVSGYLQFLSKHVTVCVLSILFFMLPLLTVDWWVSLLASPVMVKGMPIPNIMSPVFLKRSATFSLHSATWVRDDNILGPHSRLRITTSKLIIFFASPTYFMLPLVSYGLHWWAMCLCFLLWCELLKSGLLAFTLHTVNVQDICWTNEWT